MNPRIAVYPCCGTDFEEPVKIMSRFPSIEKMYFCDIRPLPRKKFSMLSVSGIECEYISGDFRETISTLPIFDCLFYRGDSPGEGGSGLFILGDSFLPNVLSMMNPIKSYIITDGSNSRGRNFEKMIRASGLQKYGKNFTLYKDQLDDYEKLKIIEVVNCLN